MLSSSSEKPEEEKDNTPNEEEGTVKEGDRVTVTTRNIPMKGELTKEIEKQTKNITVSVPVGLDKASHSSLISDESQEMVSLAAVEKKTITTVCKTCPKRVQTLVVEELDPIVNVKIVDERKVTEVKTPIRKHLTTTTTVKRTTVVTTETTTVIGPEKDNQEKQE